MQFETDQLIFSPRDVDPAWLPIGRHLGEPTHVLGAFNPALTRLPNDNLLLMVRVAEALQVPEQGGKIRAIRWTTEQGYVLDEYPTEEIDTSDPRVYRLKKFEHAPVLSLTSVSWLLPVELSPDGLQVLDVHYEKLIQPRTTYQEYGVEDPRITRIGERYYMTTCSVSSERLCTTLYTSDNGLDWTLEGIILDHQNKDMLLFPERIGDLYYALTRPMGSVYFAPPPDRPTFPGPTISLAQSPDLLHWKPTDHPFLRPQLGSLISERLGGGTPPLKTPQGWLMLFHGVERRGLVGIYRTFWAMLDANDPHHFLHLEPQPLLEARPELTADQTEGIYLTDVVFSTGIAPHNDVLVVASGELDLCCRITHIPQSYFELT
ncbi:Predicted glycosyl hydrolase, GH43/DUF377 family [Catalinimonas alkaloidigena]|uniref:Predicted glycosyl hydrolase, GH43/DUF377 family n=1 Tax=Catalinimonas alkaloidigena TaxID=1075417 RepID=A0A1G9E971_9BACT|nr:glycosidase [Catalinimonas alkaloidigena]SDK72644.1 Predicted glycosyl hydrolase, GH43/DUF377 family [Catalinimonas alkaloidigena]